MLHNGRYMMSINNSALKLAHGTLQTPVFLPDATFGYVRSVSPQDLLACSVDAVVMNTFHLMQKPGSSTVQSLGGLHKMSGWQHPIITDSGGFQAYSLIRQNASFGSISEKGLAFQPEGASRKFQLTPEKSIQLQVSFGSDIVICLDDCTHVDSPDEQQSLSVSRTVNWAKRSRIEFDRLLDEKGVNMEDRPRLFAVIQGGGSKDLRKQCAERLLEIGFDGYGYGGWPLDGQGNLLEDMLVYTRQLVPDTCTLHALGVGHPYNVYACARMGYTLFDSAMPTRDARHGRLYIYTEPPDTLQLGLQNKWMKYYYVNDDKHIKDSKPVSEYCDCPTCRQFSRGYLRHLYKQNDSLYLRLATMHNLRFMTQLTERLRTLS